MNAISTIAPAGLPDKATLDNMRQDLAAAFRYFARLGMHESVANHFSLAIEPTGRYFLINPRGKHFSRMRASDLLLLDTEDASTLNGPNAPDPTAWYIHSRVHANCPQARCIMHLHPRYATALASLKDSRMLPIDQNTMRFFGKLSIDEGFGGMGLSDDEGNRLANLLGDNNVLLMGNHGVLVAADTVAMALDEMYYCETLMIAYASGKELRIVSDNVATVTQQQWAEYGQLAIDHLSEVRAILDEEEPQYRD